MLGGLKVQKELHNPKVTRFQPPASPPGPAPCRPARPSPQPPAGPRGPAPCRPARPSPLPARPAQPPAGPHGPAPCRPTRPSPHLCDQ
ncbi:hypothetical protein JOQ06_021639 [Pogonophryne albipinna]|uniref:Uncharacterized protein n=1 Tax=Pogonophryne albipinna TaxID=1090488 RepID=A0AAD6F2X8_9TELE|nr:hypothetical protein JOQ06_021639 [Pogonophryne albipinna]